MKQSNRRRSPILSKPLSYPGEYLDKEVEILRLKRFRNFPIFIVLLVVAVYEILHAYLGVPAQPIPAILLVIGSAIYFYYADTKLRKEIKNYQQGSLGEKSVAEILDNLKKEGGKIFHNVLLHGTSSDFDIDHVVLSKHGIFVVETKTISKPTIGKNKIHSNGEVVFIPGKNPDRIPIDQAVSNAKSLRSYLNEKTGKQFRVRPVLVYPGWFVEDYADSRIWVLNPKVLNYYINREPETMNQIDYANAELYLSAIARQ